MSPLPATLTKVLAAAAAAAAAAAVVWLMKLW
jgi:hypothetical protein